MIEVINLKIIQIKCENEPTSWPPITPRGKILVALLIKSFDRATDKDLRSTDLNLSNPLSSENIPGILQAANILNLNSL